MSRERELTMTIEACGRTFVRDEEVLTLIADEPKVLDAYFAEKAIEYNEMDSTETFTYTFKSDTALDTDEKKENIAGIILGKLTMDGDNKYTTEQKIIKAYTKENHKKDDTITIAALKKEKKEYYKRLNSSPMGYQVYLVVETHKLEGEKVKIKIREDEDNLKLLSQKEDFLPVLVFDKLDDKKTEKEATDWIEIEVEKQDGEILNREEGKEIEVGIKKIQLRPMADTMGSKDEEAYKSYEGWQEALYIREDETEEGKEAIEIAKAEAAAREAEVFVTLTRTADADKQENKKSFPEKISGPGSIEFEQKAVYTIDSYGTSATEEDKVNIRWSLYKKGDPVTSYTIIDTKSKPGLYSYAKMELVDGKNQLTIYFDKALIGERIQIEPFRGSPDIDQSVKSHNHIKTTTIEDKAVPKIVMRDMTHLWLETEYKNDEGETGIDNMQFLADNCFRLEAKPLWRTPIDNPMLCLYSQGGIKKPWHGSFGKKIRDNVRNHTGADLLAEPGTKVYACVEGEITKVYTSSSLAGKTVVIKVRDEDTFKSLKKDYTLLYANKGEKKDVNFNYNGPFYLVFFHLQKNDFFKKGDIVKPDDVIGLTGISGKNGNNFTTKNPHLHFEINNVGAKAGIDKKCNPSMYFDLKSEHDLTNDEIKYQEEIKNKKWE